MDIRTIISRIHSLPESSLEKLEESLTRVDRPKGFRLTETGKVESNVFFLSEGIARAYLPVDGNERLYAIVRLDRFPVDGKEVTFWIGTEGSTLMSMKSFVNDEKGYETIELMEDSVLYMLERGQLYRLFEEDIHIANWGRKFAEKELLKTEERLIPLLFTTASERYRKLLRDNPELLLRLPLECLASYLGITPVSLSRIRAELR